MSRILVIEDDPKLSELLTTDLDLEGYTVETAKDGLDGLEKAEAWKPDLIILDVMMPKMSGYDVCRTLRRQGNKTPILMLTARGQDAEKVVGFEMGADDYVTKPFSGIELMARIKALLRRAKGGLQSLAEISFDDVFVNFKKMEAKKGGKSIELTPKEFQLLELLIRHKGEVVSREAFLKEIWGHQESPNTRTVDTQILTLRQKLGLHKKTGQSYIVTVHGAGYKFVD